jgi:serine/threonine-protein kinase
VPSCPQCANPYQLPAHFCVQCGASLPEAAGSTEGDPWSGRLVDKRYRVISRIGAGGMGLVYKVEHVQLGKVAAMKVLHADTAQDSEMVRRFRLEAQSVSRLNHPNIVQTFDFGQWEGALYLVMEYVRGDDLSTVVKREGPMPFARVAPLFVQVCSALTDAHEAGVIHRDLKPENIVLVSRRDGTEHAKVLDFGLAKLRERESGSAEITSGGQVIGTPYYMSPEQVRSEPLDIRTDVYSLGATLYRVLTGTPPFQAATPMGVLTKHVTDDLEPLRVRAPTLGLPAEADTIVARAMAKTRDRRYPTAAAVQQALEEAVVALRQRRTEAPTVASSPSPPSSPPRPSVEQPPPASPSGSASPRPWESVARADTDLGAGDAGEEAAAADAAPASSRRRRVPSRAPTLRADESGAELDASDSGDGGDRLRRQEFDQFESSLRRRKVFAWMILPALVAVVGGVGYWAVGRSKPQASVVEREPNNTPGQATLLPMHSPVKGRIGKKLPGGEPDLDYFRVPSGKGERVVTARLEGIPGVDLVVELYDGQGRALAKCDASGPGGGEWLQPTSIGPTEAYLQVRQVWIQGTPPLEEVEAPYLLTVSWRPPNRGWEMEPNDTRERATPVELGAGVRGYLSSAEDRDWFVVTPAKAGRLAGRATPPAGVDIALMLADRPLRKRSGSPKADEIEADVEAGQPVLVNIARQFPSGKDPKEEGLAGLDDSYELKLELRARP